MIAMDNIVRQLRANAEAIRAMAQTIPEEQARWKPGPDIWSLHETMAHIYNEERIDFRKHLKEMLSDPPQPWSEFRREELVNVTSSRQALEGFLSEREESIAWLQALQSPDWDRQQPTPWRAVISAGDVLVSWVEHDFLHMRQLNEILHAWNVEQAKQYSVQYAGGW